MCKNIETNNKCAKWVERKRKGFLFCFVLILYDAFRILREFMGKCVASECTSEKQTKIKWNNRKEETKQKTQWKIQSNEMFYGDMNQKYKYVKWCWYIQLNRFCGQTNNLIRYERRNEIEWLQKANETY